MPYIVKSSHGTDFKKYGIYNGAKCRLKAWHLSDQDYESLQNCTDGALILKELPKTLFVEMETPMKEQYPGLPSNWFPMTPTTTYWCLDADENIDIRRRGFPLVPNFSTTVDSATGHTLKAAIPDLGDEFQKPSQYGAMRGYISLSRVTKADSLLIAQPFNPLLFRMGPQSFPSLLCEVLKGNIPEHTLQGKCEEASRACLLYTSDAADE